MQYLSLWLQVNNNYINSGNIFSRLLWLKELLNKKSNFLIIVENEKVLNNYLKISKFLNIKLLEYNKLSWIINFCYNKNWGIIVTKDNLYFDIEKKDQFEYNNIIDIKKGINIKIVDLVKKINDFWYFFSDYKKKNSYNVVWDTITLYDCNENKIQFSFWWDLLDEILINSQKCEKYSIINNNINYDTSKKISSILEVMLIDSEELIIIDSLDFYSEINKFAKKLNNYLIYNLIIQSEKYIDLNIKDLFIEKLEDLKDLMDDKIIKKIFITKNKKVIENFCELNYYKNYEALETNLNIIKSFRFKNIVFIADDNISRIFIKKRIRRSMSANMNLLMQIKPWDYVVHIDHWIWIFKEVLEKQVWKITKEYICIDYKDNDKLFVPIIELSRVSKYIWVSNPKVTWLSGTVWEKTMRKVKENVEEVAKELLELFAKRKMNKWQSFVANKTLEQNFANSFEYVYTDDQLNIINDIYKDMESDLPMDRLLSGDVWFGKTEIAFAAIYKAYINQKQSVLISPLIVLAYEHYQKALERFEWFNMRIWVITRFESTAKIKEILEDLANHKIDLIIGTHRLLSEDIKIKNLWIIIIDEEHKFGSKSKEKLKWLKWNIDILSMSATPIPRSLNLALNWVKSISMLTTPPVGRKDIKTVIYNFDDNFIFNAASIEFERNWQIFFIHNSVSTIDAMKTKLQSIFKSKKIIVVHGQLWGDILEKRIIDFKNKKYDILLSTTVIENWIDFSNVNTIFINKASNFWISQIHQLRGRVGRSDKQAYCYLLVNTNKISEESTKRLQTIVNYSHLWAWFELAVKDLEIRWWWEILWIKQSGRSDNIGINLYLELLEQKINSLKNDKIKSKKVTTTNISKIKIELNIEAYLDNNLFNSQLDKLNFYREIELIQQSDDLNYLIDDFNIINSKHTKQTNNFFDLLRLKIYCSKYNIIKIKKTKFDYVIEFAQNNGMQNLKKLLDLDKNMMFVVKNLEKVIISIKNFTNDEKFIKYLLQLFNKKIKNNKIKLKRKNNIF